MASKKKNVPSAQLGLGVPVSTPTSDPVHVNPNRMPEGSAVDMGAPMPSRDLGPSPSTPDLESFDDYDDSAVVNDVPRMHLVDPPRAAPAVIVETVGDVFEVSRLRDNGTTVACVMWTRNELEELQRRITAALEMVDVA